LLSPHLLQSQQGLQLQMLLHLNLLLQFQLLQPSAVPASQRRRRSKRCMEMVSMRLWLVGQVQALAQVQPLLCKAPDAFFYACSQGSCLAYIEFVRVSRGNNEKVLNQI
jgi:hypothetical protein